MKGDLLQATLDVIFGGMLLYLSPILFMLCVLLFGEKLIDLIMDTLSDRRKHYR